MKISSLVRQALAIAIGSRPMTFNATTGHLPPVISNETADVKPAFRNAWKKRACLIVTAGRSRRNWFPESDFQTVGQQNLNVCTWRDELPFPTVARNAGNGNSEQTFSWRNRRASPSAFHRLPLLRRDFGERPRSDTVGHVSGQNQCVNKNGRR